MDAFEKYYNATLRYLSYRPRSIKEVRDHLQKKSRGSRGKVEEVDASLVDRIIEKLLEHKFLNDEEFARMMVRQRTEFKPKGLRLLKQELMQKGVLLEIVERVLEERKNITSELSLATGLLEKRKRQYEGLEREKLYQRAGGFLVRKGFSFEIARKAVEKVFRRS
ncbi:MAG: RecX family transcriptional regulator [Candidatus Levybacteria bacterium]|nr:RecX family transcriptional regulator [Candidatus Levybacteria bacterium]